MKFNINFLIKNTGIKQIIIKNTFWLIFAEVISRALGLFLVIYIIRILGAEEYGKFTFAFSFVSMIVLFSDLGVIDIVTREFSRNSEKEKEFSDIITLDIILSAIALGLMLIGSFFITTDPVIRKAIWILALFILITSFSGVFYSFLRSRQKMEYEAGIKILQDVIIAVAVFFVIFYFPSAINLSYGYLFANLIVLFLFLLFFHSYFQSLKLSWSKNIFKILKISWPLSLGFMSSWVYITIGSIMLGYLNLLSENGWYGAASKIALATAVPVELIIRSFYPSLSNFFITSKEKLQKSWDYLMELMICLTIPTVVGGIVMAPKIINFFYGLNFYPSILAFQLLICAVGISFIGYPFSLILVVSDQQKKNFALTIVGALMNIILGFILVHVYGFYGIILSTIISAAIILVLAVIFSKYFTPISIFNTKLLRVLAAAVFSCLVMFFIIRLPAFYNLNILYSVAAGALTYAFVLFLLYKIFKKYKLFFNGK